MKDGFKKYNLGTYSEDSYKTFKKVNTGYWQALERGEITFDYLQKNRWAGVFKELGICFDGYAFEKYFREYLFDNAIHIDGAIEMLEYLKKRYILCVASNGPFEQQLNRLKVGGMYDYFSHFFISEKIGASKPSSEFFDYCICELNKKDKISPYEIIIIGDSLSSDIAGAVNAGIKTCFFDQNHSGKTNDLNIDYIISSLNEIKNIL